MLLPNVLDTQFSICVVFQNIKLNICSKVSLQSGFLSFIFSRRCLMRNSPVSLVLICFNLLVNLNNSHFILYLCDGMLSGMIQISSSFANLSSNSRCFCDLEIETGFSIPHRLTSPSLTPLDP